MKSKNISLHSNIICRFETADDKGNKVFGSYIQTILNSNPYYKKIENLELNIVNNKIELLTKYFSLIFENKSLLLTKISLERDSGI